MPLLLLEPPPLPPMSGLATPRVLAIALKAATQFVKRIDAAASFAAALASTAPMPIIEHWNASCRDGCRRHSRSE